jgi:hypothetical protein
MPLPSISVVIPALNEARNIPHVFERIPPGVQEVVLVDGFSVDGTVGVARQMRPDVRIVRQTRNGKGNALACGVAAATGDIVAMVDADGSADPGEIPRFVEALLEGADFAKGSRFLDGGGSSDITRLRSLGNYALTAFFNACYGRNYTDLCYGFNVFWRRHASVLGLDATSLPRSYGDGRLWGDGFEIETLIHVRVAKAGLVVAEVPSFEHARIHGVSNLNAFRDGRRVLLTILTERRRTRRPPGNQSQIHLQPGPAAQVAHKSTAPPAPAAGPDQRAGGTDDWRVSRDVCATFDLHAPADAGEIPELSKPWSRGSDFVTGRWLRSLTDGGALPGDGSAIPVQQAGPTDKRNGR